MSLRRRVHVQLDPRAWPKRGLSPVNKGLAAVILVGTVAVILDTEPELAGRYGAWFLGVELGIGIVFAAEYAARVWAAAECVSDRPDWRKRLRSTMRLGAYPAVLGGNSLVASVYGANAISERHRHRYEVNVGYREVLEADGLLFTGMSPDGMLPEIVERPAHPWFVGVQFHPELKSRPFALHPLFASFIEAALAQSRLV